MPEKGLIFLKLQSQSDDRFFLALKNDYKRKIAFTHKLMTGISPLSDKRFSTIRLIWA